MAYKKKTKKKIAKTNSGFAKIATITTKSISSAFSNYKKIKFEQLNSKNLKKKIKF